VFTGGHLSHPDNNGKFPLFFNKFFYAVGNNGLSLHNTGTTHRWSVGNDKDGMTLCVSWNDASQKPVEYNGFIFTPVDIKGTSNSANILAACQAAGLQTPCDHPSYSDGKCVTVETWGHLSHNPTSGFFSALKPLASNKFFYCGNANGGKSLDNTVISHRWSTNDNQNGQTLCVLKVGGDSSAKIAALTKSQADSRARDEEVVSAKSAAHCNVAENAARNAAWTKAQADSNAKDEQITKNVLAATCNLAGSAAKSAAWSKSQAESRASDDKIAKEVFESTCNVKATAAKYAAFVGKQAVAQDEAQRLAKLEAQGVCDRMEETNAKWALAQAVASGDAERIAKASEAEAAKGDKASNDANKAANDKAAAEAKAKVEAAQAAVADANAKLDQVNKDNARLAQSLEARTKERDQLCRF